MEKTGTINSKREIKKIFKIKQDTKKFSLSMVNVTLNQSRQNKISLKSGELNKKSTAVISCVSHLNSREKEPQNTKCNSYQKCQNQFDQFKD